MSPGVKRHFETVDKTLGIAVQMNSELDKHMMWVSGGAMIFVAGIFRSSQYPTWLLSWLLASFTLFAFCILSIVISHIAQLSGLTSSLESMTYRFNYMSSESSDKKQGICSKITKFANLCAYICFGIGMLTLLIFCFLLFFYFPNYSMDNPKIPIETRSFDAATQLNNPSNQNPQPKPAESMKPSSDKQGK